MARSGGRWCRTMSYSVRAFSGLFNPNLSNSFTLWFGPIITFHKCLISGPTIIIKKYIYYFLIFKLVIFINFELLNNKFI